MSVWEQGIFPRNTKIVTYHPSALKVIFEKLFSFFLLLRSVYRESQEVIWSHSAEASYQ